MSKRQDLPPKPQGVYMVEENIKGEKVSEEAKVNNLKRVKSLDLHLGVAVKLIPILSVLFVLSGAVSVWLYLAGHKLAGEFTNLISSYNVLMQFTMFTIIVAALLFVYLFVGPALYKSASQRLNKDKIYSNTKTYTFDSVVLFATAFTFCHIATVMKNSNVLLVLVAWVILLFILTFAVIYLRPWTINRASYNLQDRKLDLFLTYLASLFMMLLPVIIFTLLVSNVAGKTKSAETIFYVVIAFYSVIAALFIQNPQKGSIFFILLVCLMPIYTDMTTFFMKALGLSQYKTTVSIDKKSALLVQKYGNISSATEEGYDSVIYKNVWVVTDFPSEIIFTNRSSSRKYFIIPKTAITGKMLVLSQDTSSRQSNSRPHK